ncbi:hypothetical protein ES705_16531 [subsurface metagenome]
MGYGSAGGAEVFLDLKDTPGVYTGQALKPVQVNAGVNALEFTTWRKFTGTKIFDGQTASPPTRYLKPVTTFPNINPSGSGNKFHRVFAIGVGGYIYMGGGRYSTIDIYNRQVWRYQLSTGEWERLSDLPNDYGFLQENCIAGENDGKIYVYAHYLQNNYTTKLLAYNIAGDSWTVYDGFGSPIGTKVVLAALTDYLYLTIDQVCKRWDYTLHTWGDRAAAPDEFEVGGNIGDEMYCLGRTNDHTYKHNKAGDSWDDQSQDAPVALYFGFAHYVEDHDELWASNSTHRTVYKYTTAGGWVSQFTYGRDSGLWDWFLQLAGETKLYALFAINQMESGFDDNVGSGSVHLYDPDSLNWCLLVTDLNAGSFIVVDTGGVPIQVEKDGVLKWTCTGLSTFFIMETGRYYFTLSKDYTMLNTKIWKSVWG